MPEPTFRGHVKFFRADKGRGGIESDDAPGDVWVHMSVIDMPGFRGLIAGQEVEFRYEATKQDTPVQTAMAWFHAINSNDGAAARARFAPQDVQMMDWMKGDASQISTFSNIHCQDTVKTKSSATVHCTFSESNSPTMGNPDTFWNIAMVRGPAGTWLINNYGQG
jgi:cold shock CspA family protein